MLVLFTTFQLGHNMDVSIDQLLQIIGEERVKASLLEIEVGRLRQLVEELSKKKEADEQPSSED